MFCEQNKKIDRLIIKREEKKERKFSCSRISREKEYFVFSKVSWTAGVLKVLCKNIPM